MNEKLPTKVLEELCKESNKRYVVQIGFKAGAYTTRVTEDSRYTALIRYRAFLIHSGYKKRLIDTVEGEIIERYIS